MKDVPRLTLLLFVIATAGVVTPRVSACAAPVFRYVLERWQVDPFNLVIFSKDPQGEKERALQQLLQAACENPKAPINVKIQWANPDRLTDPNLRDIWALRHAGTLPWVVLAYPAQQAARSGRPAQKDASAPGNVVAWAGPADPNLLTQCVLNSPARREIVRCLLSGDSAVWVFVSSGDTQHDAAALCSLTNQLRQVESALKLPEDEPGAPATDPSLEVKSKLPLRVSFPVVQVRRNDPSESAFVTILDKARPMGFPEGQPHAFLVFGRGRVMNGMGEAGLLSAEVKTQCEFLTGSCSCIIKEQLLRASFSIPLAADWTPANNPGKPVELLVPRLSAMPN